MTEMLLPIAIEEPYGWQEKEVTNSTAECGSITGMDSWSYSRDYQHGVSTGIH